MAGTVLERPRGETRRPGGQALRARAPLRVSFCGGGTDMPFYYNEHCGAVLASTINRYTYVTLAPGPDHGAVSIRSLDYDLTVKYRLEQKPVYDGVLDLAKAAIRRLVPAGGSYGFELSVQSDAPAGSGLGGSSSFTVALIGTLTGLTGEALDRYQLAELAYEIERVDLGMKGGKQDQYEIAFGGFNFIEFSSQEIVVHPLRIDPGVLRDLECHLLLCYTGKTHVSAGVIGHQEALFRQQRGATLAGLETMRRLCYEMRNALLRGRLNDFGELLNEEWRCKVTANPQVTTPAIDQMVAVARREGAIGVKLLGAGAGGYLLLFCEANRKRKVCEALEQLGGQFMNFSFIDEGVAVWRSQCR